MDEKYGLESDEKGEKYQIKHNNLNCGLLKEITNMLRDSNIMDDKKNIEILNCSNTNDYTDYSIT